jgi:UDPglucose 6-dehydrogenase
MKIAVIGSGYVGLVTSLGLSEKGHFVYNYEIDPKKVNQIRKKKNYIHEDGVDKLLKKHLNKKYYITNKIEELSDCKIFFITVNTPHTKNGIKLTYVKSACIKLKKLINKKLSDQKVIIVIKSTVVPGTLDSQIRPIFKNNKNIFLSNNPEFLREGSAINDFLFPDRIVVGSNDNYVKKQFNLIYKKFNSKIFHLSTREAELSKYFSNIFLSSLISFSNEFSNLCSKNNSNYYKILETFKHDRRYKIRINKNNYFPKLYQYMTPGPGYGGSCFPKDTKSLLRSANQQNIKMKILDAVINQNEIRINNILKLLQTRELNIKNKKILILGLGFKTGTSDIRETRSKIMIDALLKNKCKVYTYDEKIKFSSKIASNLQFHEIKKRKMDYIFSFAPNSKILKFNWKKYCEKNKSYFIDLRGNLMSSKRILILGKNF